MRFVELTDSRNTKKVILDTVCQASYPGVAKLSSATRDLPLPASVVFAELIDWKGHANWVPLTKVEIQRLGADGKALPSIVVDVDSLITKNNRSLDVELKDGDRIRVPKKKVLIF
jgi:hypothetical protein